MFVNICIVVVSLAVIAGLCISLRNELLRAERERVINRIINY